MVTKEYAKAYRDTHRDEILAKKKVYYQKNKDKLKADSKRKYTENREYYLEWNLIRKYGINREQYNSMFNEQNGRCAICNKHQSELDKPLCVDHNHTTGKVRGLLCSMCNQGIGLLMDSIEVINRASEYLEVYNED